MTSTTPSREASARFRYVADPDDARDLAFDFDQDRHQQYDAYVDWCAEEGIVPKPFAKSCPSCGGDLADPTAITGNDIDGQTVTDQWCAECAATLEDENRA